jgi:hypothetical protein
VVEPELREPEDALDPLRDAGRFRPRPLDLVLRGLLLEAALPERPLDVERDLAPDRVLPLVRRRRRVLVVCWLRGTSARTRSLPGA